MALATALMLLTGCATGASDTACPTLVSYPPEVQVLMAEQLSLLREKMLAPLITERMIPDYIALRDQVRACLARRGE